MHDVQEQTCKAGRHLFGHLIDARKKAPVKLRVASKPLVTQACVSHSKQDSPNLPLRGETRGRTGWLDSVVPPPRRQGSGRVDRPGCDRPHDRFVQDRRGCDIALPPGVHSHELAERTKQMMVSNEDGGRLKAVARKPRHHLEHRRPRLLFGLRRPLRVPLGKSIPVVLACGRDAWYLDARRGQRLARTAVRAHRRMFDELEAPSTLLV
jgi:hypothetical protein